MRLPWWSNAMGVSWDTHGSVIAWQAHVNESFHGIATIGAMKNGRAMKPHDKPMKCHGLL